MRTVRTQKQAKGSDDREGHSSPAPDPSGVFRKCTDLVNLNTPFVVVHPRDMLNPPKLIAVVLAPFLAVAACKVTGSLLRSYFVGRYTVMKDLPNTGKARPDGERVRGTAVICGGR